MRQTTAWIFMFSVLSLILAGCTTKTNYVAPQREAIGEINRLAIKVDEFPPFIFVDRANELKFLPYLIGGAAGGEIYRSFLKASDNQVRYEVKPDETLSPEVVFLNSLRNSLSQDEYNFEHVDIFEAQSSAFSETNYDAVTKFSISRWGIVTRTDSDYCTMLVEASVNIQRIKDNTILVNDRMTVARETQKRKEYFIHNEEEVQSTFKAMFEEMGQRLGRLLKNS